MKILMLQAYPCARNFKLASALRASGDEVDLAFTRGGTQAMLSQGGNHWLHYSYDLKDITGFFHDDEKTARETAHHANGLKYGNNFDAVYNLHDAGPLELCDFMKGYDVVHCHNFPDGPCNMAVAASRINGVPVIHNAHDVYQVYAGTNTRENDDKHVLSEMHTVGADGHVFVSDHQMKRYVDRYGCNLKNVIIMPCLTSESEIPTIRPWKRPWPQDEIHVAYEGVIALEPNEERNMLEIWRELMLNGIHVHVWPCHDMPELSSLGHDDPMFHYHIHTETGGIVEAMAKYDFDAGLMLYNLDFPGADLGLYQGSMPNKMFEYLAAGMPVIADPRCTDACTYLNKTGYGHYANVSELKNTDVLRDILAIAKSKVRCATKSDFTFEGCIEQVQALHKNAMEARGVEETRSGEAEGDKEKNHCAEPYQVQAG